MERSPLSGDTGGVPDGGTLLLDRWPHGLDTWPPDAPFGPWGHAPHAHPYGHLLYAASGSCVVTTPDGARTVDTARAVWVPAGVTHAARFDVEFCPVVLEGRARTSPGGPGSVDDGCPRVRTLPVGPEQRAALLATRRDHTRTSRTLRTLLRVAPGAGEPLPDADAQHRGGPVVAGPTPDLPVATGRAPALPQERAGSGTSDVPSSAHEAGSAGHGTVGTHTVSPAPRDVTAPATHPTGPLTAPIAAALAADPAAPCTLDEWAARLHVSTVSIRRAFVAETGVPFSRWRTEERLRLAVERLRAGEPVTAVAHAVGMSHNGLLAACRRDLGLPPSALHPTHP